MASSLHTIHKLCSHLSESFQLPVFLLGSAGNPVLEFTSQAAMNPLYTYDKERLLGRASLHIRTDLDFPVITTTRFYENFIYVNIRMDGPYAGTILMGPSVSYPMTDLQITALLNDDPLLTNRSELMKYYHTLPVIKKEQLVHIGILISSLINQTLWSYDTVLENNKARERAIMKLEPPEIEVSKRLQKASFHHDPLVEKRLFSHIREGRVDEVRKSFGAIPEETFGVLSKSSFLRSRKNIAISAITMATRYAMEGGLHSEIAYTLSDVFIQRVEESQQIHELNSLVEEAMCTFAEKVLQAKEESHSRTITRCKHYIFKHLYDNITLQDIADEAGLSPSYVSRLFKRETGTTLTAYIQKMRMEEAKNLLSLTQTPISDIGSWFHFTDQSHFTKVFKKHTGMTPKQFRERGRGI